MLFCSLCNMEYDKNVKSCSLSHCVACGSTRIWSEQIRQMNPLGIATAFVFFVLVFTSLFYELKSSVYFFMGMFGVMMGWTLQDTFKRKTIHFCLNCFAKGFTPISKVKLQQESKDHDQDGNFKQIEPEKIKSLLSVEISSSDKKLNFGNMMLIIGLVIATIGIILGSTIQKYVENMIVT